MVDAEIDDENKCTSFAGHFDGCAVAMLIASPNGGGSGLW